MGDGEMALVPGVQYGLSSHDNFDEHKSLIFAKLTDSSYRAIQEYLKNRVSSFCHIENSCFLYLERLGSSCVCARARAYIATYVCLKRTTRIYWHVCVSTAVTGGMCTCVL